MFVHFTTCLQSLDQSFLFSFCYIRIKKKSTTPLRVTRCRCLNASKTNYCAHKLPKTPQKCSKKIHCKYQLLLVFFFVRLKVARCFFSRLVHSLCYFIVPSVVFICALRGEANNFLCPFMLILHSYRHEAIYSTSLNILLYT